MGPIDLFEVQQIKLRSQTRIFDKQRERKSYVILLQVREIIKKMQAVIYKTKESLCNKLRSRLGTFFLFLFHNRCQMQRNRTYCIFIERGISHIS